MTAVVVLLSVAIPAFAGGFVYGIWFMLAGGLYVNRYGHIDIRWPKKGDRDKIDDKPAADSGGNFGRFARTGLMDEYIAKTKSVLLCGLPIERWLGFFTTIEDDKKR